MEMEREMKRERKREMVLVARHIRASPSRQAALHCRASCSLTAQHRRHHHLHHHQRPLQFYLLSAWTRCEPGDPEPARSYPCGQYHHAMHHCCPFPSPSPSPSIHPILRLSMLVPNAGRRRRVPIVSARPCPCSCPCLHSMHRHSSDLHYHCHRCHSCGFRHAMKEKVKTQTQTQTHYEALQGLASDPHHAMHRVVARIQSPIA